MRSKLIPSLALAAAVSLSGAALFTNANFTAVATSPNNVFSTGTVALEGNGQTGQSIALDSLFDVTNAKPDTTYHKTTTITIRGTLPVVLTAKPDAGSLALSKDNDAQYAQTLAQAFAQTSSDASWLRQFQGAILVVASRNGSARKTQVASRNFDATHWDTDLYDLSSAWQKTTTLFRDLGELQPGDVVTIQTAVRLSTDFKDAQSNNIGNGVLPQNLQDLFQGVTLKAGITFTATQD